MELGKIERNRQRMLMGKEKVVVKKEEGDEEYEQVGCLEEDKKRKGVVGCDGGSVRRGSGGGIGGLRCCQAEKCTADLTDAKQYHRRHKVCELHAKAQVVLVGGMRQRFCQQCSRLESPNFNFFFSGISFNFHMIVFLWHRCLIGCVGEFLGRNSTKFSSVISFGGVCLVGTRAFSYT